MKVNKYIKITLVAAGLLSASMLPSCRKDFFEIEDPNGMEVVDSWEDEGAIGLFLNRTYALVMPQWPTIGGVHNTSDELNNANTAFLYGTLTETSITDIATGTSLTANRYADIRRCNLAIEGLNGSLTLPESVKQTLKGQFFFLRAMTYFKLVRLYGGVPLILRAQGQNEDELAVPRAKTSECIAQIGKDLDSAAAFLPKKWTGNEVGRATRGAALALKGRAFLYWASPQFNPTNIASRWTDAQAACKAAYDTLTADGFGLITKYSDIFVTEDHKEVVIVRKYNTSRDLGTNLENVTRPFSETSAGSGSNQPTWNLVQAYPMNNGLPTSDVNSGYSSTLFWVNRDPRFAATIAYNGDLWALSGKATRKQWTYTGVLDETAGTMVTGFYCKRLCNPTLSPAQALYNSNTGGGNGMDWIEMRFAEVMLNLSECYNETGNLTEAKNLVRLVRQRAGVTAGSYDYGLSVATDVVSMRRLLLNERQIEFALEGMRYFDLRRTRNLNLITARQSFKVAPKPPYYAGTGTTAGRIYLDMLNTSGFKPRDTANLNNISVYTSMFTPTIASLEGSNVINIPDKYYVYALPNLFTQVPVIQQTNGWAGGTFDPYQ
ncbi:MAG: RagB/SusD family nutrient uptake outer membrane protein [Chitinophagales bacterium]|nr:RagB/SusD family nutrient uptake outer membrane protein [Chitinophagales bacterium]